MGNAAPPPEASEALGPAASGVAAAGEEEEHEDHNLPIGQPGRAEKSDMEQAAEGNLSLVSAAAEDVGLVPSAALAGKRRKRSDATWSESVRQQAMAPRGDPSKLMASTMPSSISRSEKSLCKHRTERSGPPGSTAVSLYTAHHTCAELAAQLRAA